MIVGSVRTVILTLCFRLGNNDPSLQSSPRLSFSMYRTSYGKVSSLPPKVSVFYKPLIKAAFIEIGTYRLNFVPTSWLRFVLTKTFLVRMLIWFQSLMSSGIYRLKFLPSRTKASESGKRSLSICPFQSPSIISNKFLRYCRTIVQGKRVRHALQLMRRCGLSWCSIPNASQ